MKTDIKRDWLLTELQALQWQIEEIKKEIRKGEG